MTQNPKTESPEIAAKRERLAKAMKDRGRWSKGYEKDLAEMPEVALDQCLSYYTSPIHVG